MTPRPNACKKPRGRYTVVVPAGLGLKVREPSKEALDINNTPIPELAQTLIERLPKTMPEEDHALAAALMTSMLLVAREQAVIAKQQDVYRTMLDNGELGSTERGYTGAHLKELHAVLEVSQLNIDNLKKTCEAIDKSAVFEAAQQCVTQAVAKQPQR